MYGFNLKTNKLLFCFLMSLCQFSRDPLLLLLLVFLRSSAQMLTMRLNEIYILFTLPNHKLFQYLPDHRSVCHF